ncbi:hypothetical protein OHA25_50125 [Nonomuraea sp. NBC_00507]|uniref:hypothetical protein n=1 Tax=Nonomuraea sp. NBC_00507 TaxID=2976002 RepID=UPI002E198F3C
MALTPPTDPTIKKSVTLRRSLAEEIESRTGPQGFSRFVDQAAEDESRTWPASCWMTPAWTGT